MTETQIQIALVKALRAAGCLVIASANGSKLSGDKAQRARQWRRLEAMGALAGAPDLFVVGRSGCGVRFIEMKAERGVVSDEQALVHGMLRLRGFPVITAYGLDDALAKCREAGLL